MADREKPRPQEIYRHFKDEAMLYQVITMAKHSETGEEMVVYQAMYGEYEIYVRPLEMFMGRVDRVKYPEAVCEYRFEKVTDISEKQTVMIKNDALAENVEKSSAVIQRSGENEEVSEDETPSKELLSFLDADTYEEKRNILIHMRTKMNDRIIDDIAASMDVTVESGDIDTRFASLLKCVQTLSKYEISRF